MALLNEVSQSELELYLIDGLSISSGLWGIKTLICFY